MVILYAYKHVREINKISLTDIKERGNYYDILYLYESRRIESSRKGT